MRSWIFDKADIANSPSFKDGIDRDTETRYRKEGVRFILDVGAELNLHPRPTLATAAVYFHRFYMYHSFKHFQRHVTALGCLFLAGKVEETPKKCRDLIQVARDKLSDHHFAFFGKDPREEVMSVERVLLQTVKFDLQVEHPYQFLLKYAKHFKIDRDKTQKMAQMAWTFVNDSLCTTLCLQWEPEITSIALMYLASRLSKVDITDWEGKTGNGGKWWDIFVENMGQDLMEDICHQVLDLYSAKQSGPAAGSSQATPATPSTARSSGEQNSHSASSSSSKTNSYAGKSGTPSATPSTPAGAVHNVSVIGATTPAPVRTPAAVPLPQQHPSVLASMSQNPQQFSYPPPLPPGSAPVTYAAPAGYHQPPLPPGTGPVVTPPAGVPMQSGKLQRAVSQGNGAYAVPVQGIPPPTYSYPPPGYGSLPAAPPPPGVQAPPPPPQHYYSQPAYSQVPAPPAHPHHSHHRTSR